MKRHIFSVLLATAVFGPQVIKAAESEDAIRLNQIGFYPMRRKSQ